MHGAGAVKSKDGQLYAVVTSFTHACRVSRYAGASASKEEISVMSAVTGDHLTYFVLAMAVIVAVTSSVRHEGDPTQALQSWLQTTFAPEAGADAGAIGENSQFPVSP
jgi:hypothetical protein